MSLWPNRDAVTFMVGRFSRWDHCSMDVTTNVSSLAAFSFGQEVQREWQCICVKYGLGRTPLHTSSLRVTMSPWALHQLLCLAGFCQWLMSAKGQGRVLILLQLSSQQAFLFLLKLMPFKWRGPSPREVAPPLPRKKIYSTALYPPVHTVPQCCKEPNKQESGQLWTAEPLIKGLAPCLQQCWWVLECP